MMRKSPLTGLKTARPGRARQLESGSSLIAWATVVLARWARSTTLSHTGREQGRSCTWLPMAKRKIQKSEPSTRRSVAPRGATSESVLRWQPTVSATGELLLRRREAGDPQRGEDLHYTFAQSLTFVARRWRNLMNQELRSVGQSQARWGTLYWLDVFGDSLNQTALADRIGVEQQTLGRVLRDLQSEGLIERVPSERDQRAKVIRLTRAADPVMRQIFAIQETVRRKLLRDIDPRDLGTCMSVFAAILANMERD